MLSLCSYLLDIAMTSIYINLSNAEVIFRVFCGLDEESNK